MGADVSVSLCEGDFSVGAFCVFRFGIGVLKEVLMIWGFLK